MAERDLTERDLDELAAAFREAVGRPGAHKITILPAEDPPDPDESDWVTMMRGLLAKQVVVTVNDDASVRIRGVLLAFTHTGEVCILHPETGETTWAWPNLHIAEVAPQCAAAAAPRPVQITVPRELLDDQLGNDS